MKAVGEMLRKFYFKIHLYFYLKIKVGWAVNQQLNGMQEKLLFQI